MQDQTLTEINFRPGVITELSKNAAEPYWTAADKIRFRFGKPELIGGWRNTSTLTYFQNLWGRPSVIADTRNLSGQQKLLIGTHAGLFSSNFGQFFDITPTVSVITTVSNISTSVGSSRVRVFTSNLGVTPDTIIAFVSAATTIGGNIRLCPNTTTTALYQVVEVTAGWFEIDTGTTAIATSVSAGSAYTMRIRLAAGASSNPVVGWSGGVWSGAFPWSGSARRDNRNLARIWSADLWGTDIVAAANGPLIYWDTQTSVITNEATIVTAAPSIIDIVRVNSAARYLIALGTHDLAGTYDPLLIRWADQESLTAWTPSDTNRAGDFRINSDGTTIKAAERVGDQILILTDKDAFAMQFVGGNDVFGFPKVGSNCGAVSKNAVAVMADRAYWMSQGRFFTYAGRVEPIDCTVLRFIFDNIDPNQYDKVVAGTISKYNEIIWFYPTAGTFGTLPENSRYVIYNPLENHWTTGTLSRTTWNDNTVFNRILAAGPKGTGIFEHEVGYTDDGLQLVATLESAAVDSAGGDDILFANKLVPNFTAPDGSDLVGNINLSLTYKKYPGDSIITKGPFIVSAGTEKISTRMRGREFSITINSNSGEQPWRMGTFRIALQPDGKR